MTKKRICVICKQTYEGYGNNAAPVKKGQCCGDCNIDKVIPARLESVGMHVSKEILKKLKETIDD